MKALTFLKKMKPSLLAMAFICMVAALVLFFLFNWIRWITVMSMFLLAVSVILSLYCLYKEQGPFQISISGLGIIALSIVIACFSSTTIHDRVQNVVNYSLLGQWDWIALIVASISLVFAACTWTSQDKTRQNTMRVTSDMQLDLLRDLFRDTYRMLEVIIAIEMKMKGHYSSHYPSEDHLLKLQYSEDVIYPEAFVNQAENCSRIKNLGINLRNANIEIRTATKHLCSPSMDPVIKEKDIQKIKKRIDRYTLKRTRDVIGKIWGYTDDMLADKVLKYVIEEAADRHDKERDKWLKEAENELKSEVDYYYHADKENFIGFLFPGKRLDSQEAKDFLKKFNYNLYYMLKSDKICLIPFDNIKPADVSTDL